MKTQTKVISDFIKINSKNPNNLEIIEWSTTLTTFEFNKCRFVVSKDSIRSDKHNTELRLNNDFNFAKNCCLFIISQFSTNKEYCENKVNQYFATLKFKCTIVGANVITELV
jgi:hypothetical protein